MTVPDISNFVVYRGNNAATVFPYSFRIPEPDMVVVKIRDYETKVIVQVLTPDDYIITGVSKDNYNGGEVIYVPPTGPLAPDHEIVISRLVPYSQDLALQNQGSFHPKSLEYQLDLIVMQIQQLYYSITGTYIDLEFLFEQIAEIRDQTIEARDQSITARDFAAAWASDPEDGPPINDGVNPPDQSSYHYSRKAARFSAAAQDAAAAAGDIDAAFDTYAEAEAALPGLPEGTKVIVWADENHDGSAARYVVEGGALAFKILINEMRRIVYDPNDIAGDIFDERNHGRASTMAQLLSINPGKFPVVDVLGFYAAADWEDSIWQGGVRYKWDADRSKEDHDGGRVIDPDHSSPPGEAGWWDDENTGDGCWVATPRLSGHGTYFNARIYGLRGDTPIEEVDYDKDLHTDGYQAYFPYKIRQPATGWNGPSDTRAWTAWHAGIRSGEQWHLPAADFGRGYHLTNIDQDASTPSYSPSIWTELEDVLITGAPIFASRVFVTLDVKLYSFWLFRAVAACQRIEWRNIYFDGQAIGHSDGDTHPHNIHTRFCIGYVGPSGEEYGDFGKPNRDIGLRNCRIRWNHPEGASPGEASLGDNDSTKLILIHASGAGMIGGQYVQPTEDGKLPPDYDPANMVYGTYIEDCLIEESQTRGLWTMFGHGSRTNRNTVLRSGGNFPCMHRMTNYAEDCEALDNYIECEGEWRFDTDAHAAPISKVHNNAAFINLVRQERNRIIRKRAPGLVFNGVGEGSRCVGNRIEMAPGVVDTASSSRSAIWCEPIAGYNGTSERRGEIRDALIADNEHIGGNGYRFLVSGATELRDITSRGALAVGIVLAAGRGVTVQSPKVIDSGSLAISLLVAERVSDGGVVPVVNPYVRNAGTNALSWVGSLSGTYTTFKVVGGQIDGVATGAYCMRGSQYGAPMIYEDVWVRPGAGGIIFTVTNQHIELPLNGGTLVNPPLRRATGTHNGQPYWAEWRRDGTLEVYYVAEVDLTTSDAQSFAFPSGVVAANNQFSPSISPVSVMNSTDRNNFIGQNFLVASPASGDNSRVFILCDGSATGTLAVRVHVICRWF